MDQICLDQLAREYPHFEIDPRLPVAWYHLVPSHTPDGSDKCAALSVSNSSAPFSATRGGEVLFDGAPALGFHGHLIGACAPGAWRQPYLNCPRLHRTVECHMHKVLRQSRNPVRDDLAEAEALTGAKRLRILFPKQPLRFPHQHTDDSGRELVKEWGRLGLVDITYTKGVNFMTVVVGDDRFALYDRPDGRSWGPRPPGLYGQALPPEGQRLAARAREYSVWTFWGRHPLQLHAAASRPSKTFDERHTRSLFLGKLWDPLQSGTRKSANWSAAVDLFSMASEAAKSARFSPAQYLAQLQDARFGLVLRGRGVKCNRDVEYLALGVVPVYTPGSDSSEYIEPLVEGVHYLRASTPAEVARLIAQHDTPQRWLEMSRACRAWYERNASPMGSFMLTRKLIDTLVREARARAKTLGASQ